MGISVSQELTAPFKDPKFIEKTAIGGLLSLIPLVGGLFPQGFVVNYIAAKTGEGKEELPLWENWGNMFGKGCIAYIITVLYMLIPIVVALILCGGGILGILSAAAQRDFGTIFTSALSIAGGLIGAIFLSIIFGFFVPMAIVRYSRSGSFGAAFELGLIWNIISKDFTGYLMTFLAGIGLGIALGILMGVAGMVVGWVPVIGWLLMPFLAGMGGMIIALMTSSAYAAVHGIERPSASPPPLESGDNSEVMSQAA
ncbi:MAG: DUF4013 domain-containing protein [bacterium]